MRSNRYAFVVAVGYALLATAWILVSSTLAKRASASVEQLEQLELIKGVAYVLVTALAVFFGTRGALSRLERSDERLRRRDAALLANERRVFAGHMAASIAHDANNVLQGVIMDLDSLRRAIGDDQKLRRLGESVERLIALNRRLVGTVRLGRGGQEESIDLAAAVREAIELSASHQHMRGCRVHYQPQGEFPIRTHPFLVHQIVTNLVVNACEATRARGRVEVRLERADGRVVLEVHDDGPGVPVERRTGIFDSLETTKEEGSGLGLFSVRACASALGGSVEVGDSPLGGACFRVSLPVTSGA
ncbi:MAG: sensor histidine kinase [Candidatus Eisenbacteria bacterium]